jgi:hypothetical protein
VVICWGCDKKGDVVARHQSRLSQIRADLLEIASKLQNNSNFPEVNKPLKIDPRPVFDQENINHNTAILSFAQLADPDLNPEFNLSSGPLLRCLRWTSQKDAMSDSLAKSSAGDWPKIFKKAEATRYLVVYNVVDFNRPVGTSPTSYQGGFSGGSVSVDLFLADLSTKRIVAITRIEARAPFSVTIPRISDYSTEPQATRKAAIEYSVRRAMEKHAREEAAKALGRLTDGTFVFE